MSSPRSAYRLWLICTLGVALAIPILSFTLLLVAGLLYSLSDVEGAKMAGRMALAFAALWLVDVGVLAITLGLAALREEQP